MRKLKGLKPARSFFNECLKTPSLTTTTLFIAMTIVFKASCFAPFIFLTEQIVESIGRGEVPYLLIAFFFVTGIVFKLVSLFTPIFKKILQDGVNYNLTVEISKVIAPRFLDENNYVPEEFFVAIKNYVLLDSENLFSLFSSIITVVILLLTLSYFAPLAVLILALGALLTFWLIGEMPKHQKFLEDKKMQADELYSDSNMLFEAKYYNAEQFLFDEAKKTAEKATRQSLEIDKRKNLTSAIGKVIEILAFLLSIGLVGYLYILGEATLGTVIVAGFFGGLLQREIVEGLFSFRDLNDGRAWYKDTLDLIERYNKPQDLDSYLEEQLKDKFELEDDLDLSVELRNVSFDLGNGYRIKDLSLSIFTGSTVAVICSEREKQKFLEVLLGARKPVSGEIGYYDVDIGAISCLRALRQFAYLTVEENNMLTLREFAGFGDVGKLKNEPLLLDALNKAGVELESQTATLDSIPRLDFSKKKQLLYARILFGERRFIIIDGFSFDLKLDNALLEEIAKEKRRTLVFLTPDDAFAGLGNVDKVLYLSEYSS